MRLAWISIVAFVAIAGAEALAQTVNLFRTVRPQLLIGIRRDPNGSRADLIEARTIDPKYPPEQLRAQIIELGRLMGSEPRGLNVTRSSITGDASMTTIKATCAIDNIIDRESTKLNLGAIAKAFAGYAAPNEVTGLSVQFLGEAPKKTTLLEYGKEGDPVMVQGSYDPTFNGVEYRIKINSQDPKLIEIPEGSEQKAPTTPSTDAGTGTDWTVWGLVFIAAIAVGALVYSLLTNSKVSKGLKR